LATRLVGLGGKVALLYPQDLRNLGPVVDQLVARVAEAGVLLMVAPDTASALNAEASQRLRRSRMARSE
jgi:hypothetical protein